jgi:acetyl-CoA carboxylase alpha subunit
LLREALAGELESLAKLSPPELVESRYRKFRQIAPFFAEA